MTCQMRHFNVQSQTYVIG